MYVGVVIGGNWWQRRQRIRTEHAELGWKINPPSDDERSPPATEEPTEAQLIPPAESTPLLTAPGARPGRLLSTDSLPGLSPPGTPHHARSQYYDEDAQRAGFSLLGAVEFRDVVKHLQHDMSPSSSHLSSRPSSPMRSPLDAGDIDYFHHHHHLQRHHHRRSSSQQGLAVIEPALRRVGRSRSGSLLHPAAMARSRQASAEYPDGLETVPGSPGNSNANGHTENLPLSPMPPSSPTPRQRELRINIPQDSPDSIDLPQLAVIEPSGLQRQPTMPLSRTNTVDIVAKRGVAALGRALHMLFPSLHGFQHKSIIGMALAVLSVPAIFILTLTLPVVDDGRNDEGGVALPLTDDEPLTDERYRNDEEDDEDEDRQISPRTGQELHHLVDELASLPRRGSSSMVRSGAMTPCSSDHDDDASCCSHDSDECDTLAFNPHLTAAQCIFGPSVCAYLAFREY